jgi:hypothetical protein
MPRMVVTPHKRDVGERLRQAREALGYSQAEFARAFSLDQGALNHWERGRHYPPPPFLLTLWERHRISADWLYFGEIGGLPARLADGFRAGAPASPAPARAARRPGHCGTTRNRRGRDAE